MEPKSDSDTSVNLLMIAQGTYYLASGAWPLLSMNSFESVTGPKTDKWLVKTVGVLVAAIGATLALGGFRKPVRPETKLLAVMSAIGLTAIDITYTAKQRISPIYLLDSAVEAMLVLAWANGLGARFSETRRRKNRETGVFNSRAATPFQYLETYLNDHLAGSMGALDLLKRLEAADGNMTQSLIELRVDVEEDQRELKSLMARLNVKESYTRQIGGWLAEKVVELKMCLDDPGMSLRLLESLEAIALGIDGKLALWRALGAAAEDCAALRVLSYEHLAERAIDQRRRVESLRLQAVKLVLA
jgi:hypothetical protein